MHANKYCIEYKSYIICMLAPPRVSGGGIVRSLYHHQFLSLSSPSRPPPRRLQPDQLMKIPKLILFDQVRFSGLNNSK